MPKAKALAIHTAANRLDWLSISPTLVYPLLGLVEVSGVSWKKPLGYRVLNSKRKFIVAIFDPAENKLDMVDVPSAMAHSQSTALLAGFNKIRTGQWDYSTDVLLLTLQGGSVNQVVDGLLEHFEVIAKVLMLN